MNACNAVSIQTPDIKLKHLISATFHTATADISQLLTGGGTLTGNDVTSAYVKGCRTIFFFFKIIVDIRTDSINYK